MVKFFLQEATITEEYYTALKELDEPQEFND